MKILQLITRMDTIGGAQAHVRDISIAMQERGNTVYLVAGGSENIHNELESNCIHLIHSPNLLRSVHPVTDIKAFFEVRNIIKKVRPDIIATHSSKAGMIGRLAGWSLRTPTVFTAHGWAFTEGVSKKRKWVYIFFEKTIGLLSNYVITVSDYDKQLALKYKVLPEKAMKTIHNGVHDIELKDSMGRASEQPNMIMVARFSPPKQQLKLLQALNHLRHIEWNLYFAGDGPFLQEAKKFVEMNKLSNRVIFLGNRHDIKELLNKSDLFVLLSDWEGLPLSILEAMRCSLPILASDVGGVKEAVIQSVNGYIVPKNDELELRKKLTLLLTKSSLRLEMGKKGRQLYEEKFTFHKMHDKLFAFYENIIQTEKS